MPPTFRSMAIRRTSTSCLPPRPTSTRRGRTRTADRSFARPTAGSTWAGAASAFGITWRVARCASAPATVYAATREGLARSLDGGVTWTAAVSVFNDADVAIAPSDCNTVYNTEFGARRVPLHRRRRDLRRPVHARHPIRQRLPPSRLGRPLRLDAASGPDARRASLQHRRRIGLEPRRRGDGARRHEHRNVADEARSPLDVDVGGARVRARRRGALDARAARRRLPVRGRPRSKRRQPHALRTWSTDETTVDGTTFATGGLTTNPLAFAFDPSTPQTVYAATEIGGVFKSTNGGGTWAPRVERHSAVARRKW